jgi:hypothetical protein
MKFENQNVGRGLPYAECNPKNLPCHNQLLLSGQSTNDSDSCNESSASSSTDLLSIKNTFLHFNQDLDLLKNPKNKKRDATCTEPIGKFRSAAESLWTKKCK